MTFISLGLAILFFLAAVILAILVRKLSVRLGRIETSLARTSRKLEFVEETLKQQVAMLSYRVKKNNGQLKFPGDMTFKEALAIDPRTQEIMAEMHVGGCPDCAVDLNQTLAHGATINNVDVEAFLSALNNLPEPESQPKKRVEPGHPRLNILS